MPRTQVPAETKANLQSCDLLWPGRCCFLTNIAFCGASLLYFWQNNWKNVGPSWNWHCKAARHLVLRFCSWVRRRNCCAGATKNAPNVQCNCAPCLCWCRHWQMCKIQKYKKYKNTTISPNCLPRLNASVQKMCKIQIDRHSCLTSVSNLEVTSSTLKLHGWTWFSIEWMLSI